MIHQHKHEPIESIIEKEESEEIQNEMFSDHNETQKEPKADQDDLGTLETDV